MGEKPSIEELHRIIEFCESRLSQQDSHDEDQNSDYCVFPPNARVLYHQMLGDSYLRLHQSFASISSKDEFQKDEMKIYGKKCIAVLESGMKIAADYLQIVDPVRLLLSYNYCEALCLVKRKHFQAKLIAEKVVELASSHINDIPESALITLQHLRDQFMTFGTFPVIPDDEDEAVAKDEVKYQDADEQEDDHFDIAEMFAVRKRSVKFKEIENIRSQRMASIGSPGANKRLLLARQLRKTVFLPVPVMLETITSASHILKALDRAFRAYIRGNALPGQLSGGATVDLAGQTMSFRAFVLQGPYMSWKGFVSFLLDFNIAALPSNKTRSGKAFYRSMKSPSLEKSLAMMASKPGPDPLLEMSEAAMIFLESSQSATPALVLNKFMKLYEEIANNLTVDPWNTVYEWAESYSDDEWDIQYGLNFMQFVDCLGKLGIISYSSGRFNEMLPTISDKIEHFFTAYLGFADQKRWNTKVDSKLKSAKKIIQQLGEKKADPTNGASTKRGAKSNSSKPSSP